MWRGYRGLGVIEEMKTHFEGKTERNEHLVLLANLPLTHSDDEYFYAHKRNDLSYGVSNLPEDSTFKAIDELVSTDKLKKAIWNRIMVHGHTPYPFVYRAGNFISCDTGASVLPNGKLSFINL